MSEVRPGDVIAGKFRIERVLGEGGMGYVVAARHLQLGQMVALKFIKDDVLTPEYKSRFLREARNTVRLKSKHVSRVLDVGTLEGGSPYMVMEYLEGTDLSELLHSTKQPLPVADACDYVIQACEAIAEAHANGIVHRDLKPANLFLTKGSLGEPVVKVLDFGVSKVLELDMDDSTSPGGRPRANPDSVVTKATDLLGSPSYMAPEQVASARNADAQSDIWSLGVILFRLISGKAPFNAQQLGELIQQIMNRPVPSLREAKPDIPHGLEHVVARCLERDRAQRFRDVTELARALAPYSTPVVTPSLERIAILGPALVTAAPPSQQRPMMASSHSWSNTGNNTGNGPWSSPPASGPTNPPPNSTPNPQVQQQPASPNQASAMILVVLAAAAIILGVIAFVKSHRQAGAQPPEPEPVQSVTPQPTLTVSPDPTPPNLDPTPAPPPTDSSAVTTAPPSSPGAKPVVRPKPKPSASAAPQSEDDIPTTRE